MDRLPSIIVDEFFTDENGLPALVKTDGRTFGEQGTSRQGIKSVNIQWSQIGFLKQNYGDNVFTAIEAASTRAISKNGSWDVQSKPDTFRMSVTVKDYPEKCQSVIKAKISGQYSFAGAYAPNIDMVLNLTLTRKGGGKTNIKAEGTHNLFPAYEMLIDRRLRYRFMPDDGGPTPVNLNRSTDFKREWEVGL